MKASATSGLAHTLSTRGLAVGMLLAISITKPLMRHQPSQERPRDSISSD
jgi:hypothetical protein